MLSDYNAPFSSIKILSQIEAEQVIAAEPNKWNVISIWSGDGGFGKTYRKTSEPKVSKALSVLKLGFHDITESVDGLIQANSEDISKAIKFARSKYGQPLIVHCHAGISRSSAITLLILLDFFNQPPFDNPISIALENLCRIKNPRLIMPNRYIVETGIKLIAGDNSKSEDLSREINKHPIFREFYK